ncbi:MAG: 7-carboxy-7-deazaguanine synthase QueE [Bacteroidetes bacterium]|nr:7-carboxy-7-deazaguanine synthase QueE [Bacteroidota bacterium]MCL2303554.1 7-carboxy-7-deazaguanine synthase QueE [Lentimicrobiaceae bacterium]
MLTTSVKNHSPHLLPIMEEFYSLQGEGVQTGKPAYFLRIGGCNVGCHFCDVKESWNANKHVLTHVDEIVQRIVQNPSKAVVVTGGEPMLYNLDYFCEVLKNNDIQLFLETSGSEPISGHWDWICVSPKKNHLPQQKILQQAHELKIVICNESDFDWAEENAKYVNSNCQLLLQPEWSNSKIMMPKIVDYILKNPKWRISLQSHKYMDIP